MFIIEPYSPGVIHQHCHHRSRHSCTNREHNNTQQSKTILLFTSYKTSIIIYYWWKQPTKWNQGNKLFHCNKATTKLYHIGLGFCSQLYCWKCAYTSLIPRSSGMKVLYFTRIQLFNLNAHLTYLHAINPIILFYLKTVEQNLTPIWFKTFSFTSWNPFFKIKS